MRVLILVHEPLVALAVHRELQHVGHQVIGPAKDLGDALYLCYQYQPSVALLDADELNLRALTMAVRRITQVLRIQVILLTTAAKLPPVLRECAAGVMSKPFEIEHVSGTVNVARRIALGANPTAAEIPASLSLRYEISRAR